MKSEKKGSVLTAIVAGNLVGFGIGSFFLGIAFLVVNGHPLAGLLLTGLICGTVFGLYLLHGLLHGAED